MNIKMNKPATQTIRIVVVSVLLSWTLLIPANNVRAETPTDEQLLELERQIEQQETEQAKAKKRAQVEAERKAEEEAKHQAELEKRRVMEEEARKQAEVKEKQRAEEARIKADTGKKEKYSLLITEAEQAIKNKDKELALSKYAEALKLYPDDPVASSGIKEVDKLPEKVCVDFPGIWEWEGGGTINIRADGTLTFEGTFSVDGTWTCADPKARMFTLKTSWGEQTAVLRSDGCLLGKGGGGREGCYWKKGN